MYLLLFITAHALHMPKRPNQLNNTKTACKKQKSCLAIHVDTVALLEVIQAKLDEVLELVDQVIADAPTPEASQELDQEE